MKGQDRQEAKLSAIILQSTLDIGLTSLDGISQDSTHVPVPVEKSDWSTVAELLKKKLKKSIILGSNTSHAHRGFNPVFKGLPFQVDSDDAGRVVTLAELGQSQRCQEARLCIEQIALDQWVILC